jgi:uncharacterized protein YaeQ
MALRATVYKCTLDVSDLDRSYYGSHELTLARHPSETEERLMLRLLAFALYADDGLAFGRGLSTDDEPDVWLRDATGNVVHWIELGLPDERWLRRAAGRARQVTLIAYGERALGPWLERFGPVLQRLDTLEIKLIADADLARLGACCGRNMQVSCTVQDGRIWFSAGADTLELELKVVHAGR